MNRSLLLSLLALCLLFVLPACDVEVEGDEAGECDDGVDNDQDGDADCADDGCAAAAACAGDDDDTAGDDDDTAGDDDDTTGDDDDSAGDDDDSTPAGTDDDGDGVTVEDGDCDDGDDTIYPGAPEVWGDGIDQDCDGVADVAGAACVASFNVGFPDGSSTTLDGCLDWSLEAAFDYDPDDPPEVRSFTLNFGATTSVGFECEVTVVQDQVCGTGYYDAAATANTTTYAMMDCSGVANEYEQTYTASTGYLRVDTLDTGSVAGNFTGLPLATTVQGYLSVDDGTGVSLSGNFSLTLEQVVTDEEQQTTCAVSDGDEDDDGVLAPYYDGDDCDDGNAGFLGLSSDADCDGVLTAADCDDTDSSSTVVADDGDCDGVLTAADCDDTDSSVGFLCGPVLPAGTFTMGCTAGQSSCASDESPAHSVTLSHDFWMGENEVTMAHWQAQTGSNPSYFSACGAGCPVDTVNWYEALTFANAVSVTEGLTECYSLSGCSGIMGAGMVCSSVIVTSNSGLVTDCEGYRLPTEAEWEYAARGGEDLLYSGSNTIQSVAWVVSNSGGTTHPVATLQANAWGLYDMSGNVHEWTWDRYDSSYYDPISWSLSNSMDPEGPNSGGFRVFRGGYWNYSGFVARVAYRGFESPGYRSENVGFRLSRTVP